MPPGNLNLVSEELASPLTKIFNQAIEDREWPTEWKKGDWTRLHKKEDPHDKANYRPVTVLPAVDKIFEQLLCKQIANMFEHIFDRFMSAYRKQYSNETILICLVED